MCPLMGCNRYDFYNSDAGGGSAKGWSRQREGEQASFALLLYPHFLAVD